MKFHKFVLMVKLSFVTFLVLGVFVGGGMFAYVEFTSATFDDIVNVDTPEPQTQENVKASTSNEYPPPEGILEENRIDTDKYEWEANVRDPDDPGTTTYEAPQMTLNSKDIEYYIFQKINNIRREHNLEPLQYSATLSSVGRAHSEDMNTREYFNHVNPDGEHSWERFRSLADENREDCSQTGENIARTWNNIKVKQPDDVGTTYRRTEEGLAQGIVRGWMNSPGHRAAILKPEFDVMGIGVHLSEESYRFGHKGAVSDVTASQEFCDLDKLKQNR